MHILDAFLIECCHIVCEVSCTHSLAEFQLKNISRCKCKSKSKSWLHGFVHGHENHPPTCVCLESGALYIHICYGVYVYTKRVSGLVCVKWAI